MVKNNMTSSTSYAQGPPIPDLLYEMGAKMKKISTWFWIIMVGAVVAFTLGGIPLIIGSIIYNEILLYIGAGIMVLLSLCFGCLGLYSLYLFFQYMNSVKDIRDATGDPLFEKVYQYLLIGFILQFVGLSIVTFILNILIFMEMEKWGARMEKELPTPEMANVTEGYKWLKISTIATVCCALAAIMTPISYAKIGKALMAEYNSSQFGGIGTTRPWPMEISTQTIVASQPTQMYGAPQQQVQTQPRPQPKPQQTEAVKCPHCGVQTPKHLAGKFCGKCGKSYIVSPSPQTTPAAQTYKPDADIARCAHCGAENPKGTVFCEVCGKSI